MPQTDLYKIFISRLNRHSIIYMITGAVASIFYGEPRLTNDMDLVIDLKTNDIDQFAKAFPIEKFYCPPTEIIQVEISRPQRGHFNLIHHQTGFKADIYAAGKDELHKWGLENRRSIDVGGENYWMAPIEYVILRKLEYYREGGSGKHLYDIAGVIEISGSEINHEFLETKIEAMKLQSEWRAAQSFKT